MKPPTCHPLALAGVLFLMTFATVTGQSPTNATHLGTVSGNVKIKGKAAPGIVVALRKSEANNPYEPIYKAKTDEEGNYQIRSVPPGSYDVYPSAPAYVAETSNERSKQIVLGEGENVSDLNFSLVRGGVITGKVTDADGRAIIQERVTLYWAEIKQFQTPQPSQQRPQLYPFSSTMTDDRGIYRFFGLMAGRFRVGAGTGADIMSMSNVQGRPSYSQTFHPDASEFAGGSVVQVGEGTEATNIDITLGRAQQTFAASGRTIDDKGSPVPSVRFGVQRITEGRPQFVNAFTVSNNRGDFVLEGLIPGKYQVFLMPGINTDLRSDSVSFEVLDQDVTGLQVKLSSGASISGVVAIDSENKSAWAKLGQLQIRAYVAPPQGATPTIGGSASGSINPDGSFRLGGLAPGMVNLSVGGMFNPVVANGFIVSRIEREGVLQQPRGFEIKDGEQVTGVRIVLSYGTATLRGVVQFQNGTMPGGANIQLRLSKIGEATANLRPPRLDSRYHFVVEALPAGTYEVSATVFIPNSRSRPTAKQQVVLADDGVTETVLTVDLGGTNPQ
jgi:hypothetical protein